MIITLRPKIGTEYRGILQLRLRCILIAPNRRVLGITEDENDVASCKRCSRRAYIMQRYRYKKKHRYEYIVAYLCMYEWNVVALIQSVLCVFRNSLRVNRCFDVSTMTNVARMRYTLVVERNEDVRNAK
jgi:hypothetical protein